MGLRRANFTLGNNSTQMGWSFSSLIDDAEKAVKTQVKQVESKISTQSKEILGDKLYTQASALVKKEGEKLTEAAENFAAGKMDEYLAKPENQKAILDGGVDAVAAKTKAYLWSLTESYKANGLLGLRLTHPVLFYSTATIAGLSLAAIAFRVGRLVVGKKSSKKSSTVKMKSNPRTKKRVYRPKASLRANPRKEEKVKNAPKNIYVCVSNEVGEEEFFGLLSEMPDYMRENLLSEDDNWMATAYKGTDKQYREAKNDTRYHHSSHSAPKYLKEVDLGNYL